ncbi:DHA2 family efflux MFS transporter permease subunit [Rossellomorea aquimaris]|uniref:DHA2 family efflux MFS transporter permease subunit n=1 Tax=Rossellomorea aquimaris TaxID=189382 RepID=A0A5D4TU28_9BACI|nr:DHA2 family efflux MFS transporter permease subunit [Rossellomorea aquimaris]TYS79410.1 DHA2 family efflux MFS transporter permease subunit [Rossellomorea aquimaris]
MEHLEPKKKILIMLAIMSAMLFAALNQTIVGTALPTIISELGGIEYYSWVFTIFMLTSSVTAILVGKLSDMYGRKPFILIGLGVFTAGSFLNGLSTSIIELIAFRGIQGLGAGMIMSTSFTAVGDLFAPRERGRWQGLMGGIFGLASVFGPTLGGWIVDNAEWHWVFWVFLPFGLVAFLMIWRLFPSQTIKEKKKVDYLGSIMLSLTIIPLLLAFTWGGNDFEWVSFQITGLFSVTAAALILFIMIEKRAANPVLPLHLFKNQIFTLSNAIGFILGAGMFGAIMYMPFFIQGVIGTSATKSGFVMMPMTLSMVFASAIGGQIITKTGKYKLIALIGLFVMGSGLASLSMMASDTTNTTAVINMIIVGLGLGLSFPVFTLTVQNAVQHQYLGVATAATQLFRQIGGTVGVAIMGTVMNNSMSTRMNQELSKLRGNSDLEALPPEAAAQLQTLQSPQSLMDGEKLQEIQASLPNEMQAVFVKTIEIVRESLSYSLTNVFLIGAFVLFSGFLLTFFLKEIPLRMTNKDEQENEIQSGQESQSVKA